MYCFTFLGASNKNVMSALQISQNKLSRATCGVDRIDGAIILFYELKIFNVKDVYSCTVCSYIYKSISGNTR